MDALFRFAYLPFHTYSRYLSGRPFKIALEGHLHFLYLKLIRFTFTKSVGPPFFNIIRPACKLWGANQKKEYGIQHAIIDKLNDPAITAGKTGCRSLLGLTADKKKEFGGSLLATYKRDQTWYAFDNWYEVFNNYAVFPR